jgi:hypothetical protein
LGEWADIFLRLFTAISQVNDGNLYSWSKYSNNIRLEKGEKEDILPHSHT